jgi:ATP-dependent DNA helicase RecG
MTTGVDAALALPREQVGPALLALAEDQWFDRKSARIAPRDLGPPLTAFRQAAIDFTVPPTRVSFSEAGCVNNRGDNDYLLVIRVEPGERVHEVVNGDCYLRVGDETRRLNYRQHQELEFDKGQSQYDGFPCQDVTIGDLDGAFIEDYRQSVGAGSAESVLRARSLLTRDGAVSNAAYLLFGRHPQDIFPQAYVRVIRFLTNERGTGARLGVEEGADRRIEGPIPRCIDEAAAVIDELLPRRRYLGSSGRFEAHPIVPRDAWLEGLVNAVIHRSYSLAGDHIRVEIYPNRIEMESPGRFPGLANPAKPLEITRFARNPRIARVCADLRIGQELGEGIKRIFDEMKRGGLTDPVYKQTSGSVRLELAAIPRLDPRLVARLPSMSQVVLDALRSADRPLSTGDIAEIAGMSRPAVAIRLKALEAEELVQWSGKSVKDPRAVWILTEG